MRRIYFLSSFVVLALCGCGSTVEFVRTETYSQTWCGLEVCVLELESERFETRIKLIPMFHIADRGFYDAVKKEADKADLVIVEGLHGLDDERLTKERKRLDELLRPFWLVPQITALELGNNARTVDLDVELMKKTVDSGGSLMPSLDNLLRRFRPAESGAGKGWNPDRPEWEQLRNPAEAEREPRRLLAYAAIKAIENLADEPDFIGRRNKALIEEVERVISGSEQTAPKKLAILYGAAHVPGILKMLKERMGYEVTGEPAWRNVWAYRQRLIGKLLPYRAGLNIEANRDALLIRHREELWQCFFGESLTGGYNVVVVYFRLRNGEWRRRQVTGLPDEHGKVPENEPVTFEAPYIFLHESGAKFTPVLLKSAEMTRILFHAVRKGDGAVIYLDPARLPDGTWLSTEYAVFPGGGRLPVPPDKKITIGPEYRFSRKP